MQRFVYGTIIFLEIVVMMGLLRICQYFAHFADILSGYDPGPLQPLYSRTGFTESIVGFAMIVLICVLCIAINHLTKYLFARIWPVIKRPV
jgi:hypothetical protein